MASSSASAPSRSSPRRISVRRLSGVKACSRHSEVRLNRGGFDLEEGILRGGPDEHDEAVLDGGQEHVLLGLGEAVHLVDEEHGPLALLAQAVLRLGQRLADVLHAGGRGRERGQVLGGGVGQEPGQGGLAGAGGPPQDRRADPVRLGQAAQRRAGADEVLLAHDLVEGAGAEAGGQGGLAPEAAVGGVGEEAHPGPAARSAAPPLGCPARPAWRPAAAWGRR